MEMNKHVYRFIYIQLFLLTLLITACAYAEPEVYAQPELVIEGWIADDAFPVVLVTTTASVSEQEDTYTNHIVQWARVSICSDGDTTYLTGMYNEKFLPPYVYTTSAIKGKTGQQYQLIVDWNGKHAEATTSIPESVMIEDIWCEPCSESETLRQIAIKFHDNPSKHNYYLIFNRETINKVVNPFLGMFGAIDDIVLKDPEVICYVRNGNNILSGDKREYSPYYSPVDNTVEVTLAHVDSITYSFWHQFLETKTISNNFLFRARKPIVGNIIGGLGVWYGYGRFSKTIEVK